jgi:hypothetical protein
MHDIPKKIFCTIAADYLKTQLGYDAFFQAKFDLQMAYTYLKHTT